MAIVAVLTAAGSGTRLGCSGPKALVEIAGIPMVLRSACALAQAGVERIVITAPEDALDNFSALFPANWLGQADVPGEGPDADSALAPHCQVRVVAGSRESRQASVYRGLTALAPTGQDTVLVHDAARPLTPVAAMRRVIDAIAGGAHAVIPALPVTDTLKRVDIRLAPTTPLPHVVDTPDRASLVAVQTPQGFRGDVLMEAHEQAQHRAANESTAATDDAGLVEEMGQSVHVVLGAPESLKITTSLDLALAQLLAES
ncbi:MAG: IspD/TarI family cytidylyltransferase [Actinomycetaceae bacterium]|nr:IspD/TarI family cytidylyltransferase [Actinomycetaceae bacterium]